MIESIINTIDLDKDKNILYYQQKESSLMYYISRFSNEDKVIHALSKNIGLEFRDWSGNYICHRICQYQTPKVIKYMLDNITIDYNQKNSYISAIRNYQVFY